MPRLSILLLLLTVAQDPKKSDAPADRTKKAAVVEVDIVERPRAAMVPAPAPVPGDPVERARQAAQAQVRIVQAREARLVQLQLQNARRLTLEMKATGDPDAADADDAPQPFLRAGPLNIMDMALASDNFDRWIFDDTRSDEGRRGFMGGLLSDKIHAVQKEHELGPDQLRKLRLAGTGDIKRFLDRVEAARLQFEAVRQDYNAGREALGRLESFATEYTSGPFGPGSLFEKTLSKISVENEARRAKR
jgi:hypothetical protein